MQGKVQYKKCYFYWNHWREFSTCWTIKLMRWDTIIFAHSTMLLFQIDQISSDIDWHKIWMGWEVFVYCFECVTRCVKYTTTMDGEISQGRVRVPGNCFPMFCNSIVPIGNPHLSSSEFIYRYENRGLTWLIIIYWWLIWWLHVHRWCRSLVSSRYLDNIVVKAGWAISVQCKMHLFSPRFFMQFNYH